MNTINSDKMIKAQLKQGKKDEAMNRLCFKLWTCIGKGFCTVLLFVLLPLMLIGFVVCKLLNYDLDEMYNQSKKQQAKNDSMINYLK